MKEKKQVDIGKQMLIVLGFALIVGLCFMFSKDYLISHGMNTAWEFINWLLFQDITAEGGNTSIGLFYIVQTLFVNGIQLAIVPLVVTSLSLGLCSISDTAKFGRIAIKSVLTFLMFYVIGCIFAILASIVSVNIGWFNINFGAITTQMEAVNTYEVSNPLNILLKFVPNNILATWIVNNQMLAVVFVSISLGLCINILGSELKVVKGLLQDISKIIQIYLNFIINKCGPICIFCMIVRTFAVYGKSEISSLLHYMVTTAVVLIFCWFIMYPVIVSIICKVNGVNFLKKTFKVGMFAFSVNSSAATLPLNQRTTINELGCDPIITDFVLPTGATINMNGTAIEHCIAVTFIATACGYSISPILYLTIMLLAIGSSAGTPAIPNAGTVMLYATLIGAGFSSDLAVAIYVLLLSLNKPIDMLVTALNVVGDSATACIVSSSEGVLDRKKFNTQ